MKVGRLVFLFVVLTLVMSLMAACAAPPTPTAPVAPTEAPQPATTPASSEKAGAPAAAPAATAAPAKPAVTQGGKLVFGLAWEPSRIDPHVTSANEGAIIDRHVFDSLIRQAPDGSFHPSLATDWKMSDDGRSYTYQLRRDVTFHDGTPFNAKAVKYSLDRIANPATKSQLAVTLIGPYESTDVLDDYTVRINLKERFAPFLSGIAQPNVAMVSQAAVEKGGDNFDDYLVGTGPFILKEWARKDHITLVRNPAYNWGSSSFDHQGPAYLDEIEFKFIAEATVRVGTLQTGETRVINDVPPLDFKRLEGDKAFSTHVVVQPGSPLAIAMNSTRHPFDDLKVRQAMQYAIDSKAIVDTLFAGLYPVSYSPLAPNTLGYWEGAKDVYGYDPAKAKKLLEEAGWVDTNGDGIRDKNGQPFKIWWPTFTFQGMNKMAEIVQAQLKEVGIDLKVDVMAFPALYSAANKCEQDLAHFGFGGVDPDMLSVVFLSSNVGSGWAWSCTKDKEIDDLLLKGRAAADTKERVAIYTELQKLIMDKALIVPVRQWAQLFAARSEIKGLKFDPLGFLPVLYDVYIQK